MALADGKYTFNGVTYDKNNIKEYLLSDPDAASTVLAYFMKYVEINHLSKKDAMALMNMLGINGLTAEAVWLIIDAQDLDGANDKFSLLSALLKIRKEFVVTGLDELFLEGIITNAKVKRNRIKANASTIHSGVIVKKYQKRNFTAESLSTIHSAANSINSRTFNQTSSWTSFSGEEWYNPIGTGLILRGIQKYFEKLYSINNTSKVQIANVYETVYSLDATFANRLRSQADNMRGYAAGITDLAGTIG